VIRRSSGIIANLLVIFIVLVVMHGSIASAIVERSKQGVRKA